VIAGEAFPQATAKTSAGPIRTAIRPPRLVRKLTRIPVLPAEAFAN